MSRFVNWNLVAFLGSLAAFLLIRFKLYHRIGIWFAAFGLVATAIGWIGKSLARP